DVGEGGLPWTPEDYAVARDSMATQARRLHRHPSVIAFLVGSDFAPPEDVERGYLEALRENDWPNPVVSSAADASSPQLGRSGMKMTGPYGWVPPAYWYEQKVGGAYGFNSETSAGATIPTLASLQAMLGADELRALWEEPDAPQFHAGRQGSRF